MSTEAPPPTFDPERQGPISNCQQCGAALAPDQRYCLSCGRRLSAPRVDYRGALGLGAGPAGAPAPAPHRDTRGPLLLLGGIATILLALGVGIVIGRGNGPAAGSSKPTVVTVAGATAAPATGAAATGSSAATAASSGSVTDEWPASASGWTVELSSLVTSANASDVSAAKSAATAKGATAVGVLNGDQHGGTPASRYVIYSGRFTSKRQAQAARAKLTKDFPGALVLHVTPKRSSGSGANATAQHRTGVGLGRRLAGDLRTPPVRHRLREGVVQAAVQRRNRGRTATDRP